MNVIDMKYRDNADAARNACGIVSRSTNNIFRLNRASIACAHREMGFFVYGEAAEFFASHSFPFAPAVASIILIGRYRYSHNAPNTRREGRGGRKA